MGIKNFVELLRPKQWYKNLVIFLPLIFAKELFNLFPLRQTIIGFIALSLVSSGNYIINDIVDKEKDRKNPEKKTRPIAAGKIKIIWAMIIALMLFAGGFFISYNLSLMFLGFTALLFLSTQLYSFILKKEAFADILMISINFVIRTTSGAFVITKGTEPYMKFSYWLILCPFFLALFLATSKRQSEVLLLERKATKHREVLKYYTKEITSALIIISTTLLILCYAIYTFFSPYPLLMLTLPTVLYMIFRFFYFAETGSIYARHPELIYKDKKTMIALLITLIITFISIYQ